MRERGSIALARARRLPGSLSRCVLSLSLGGGVWLTGLAAAAAGFAAAAAGLAAAGAGADAFAAAYTATATVIRERAEPRQTHGRLRFHALSALTVPRRSRARRLTGFC
jgi:hypothetical protein